MLAFCKEKLHVIVMNLGAVNYEFILWNLQLRGYQDIKTADYCTKCLPSPAEAAGRLRSL